MVGFSLIYGFAYTLTFLFTLEGISLPLSVRLLLWSIPCLCFYVLSALSLDVAMGCRHRHAVMFLVLISVSLLFWSVRGLGICVAVSRSSPGIIPEMFSPASAWPYVVCAVLSGAIFLSGGRARRGGLSTIDSGGVRGNM